MVGVAAMLLGMILIAISVIAPDPGQEGELVARTTTTTLPPLAPSVATGTTAPVRGEGLGET